MSDSGGPIGSVGTVEDLHAAASKVTGLIEFGPDDYTDGLAVLLESCERDAGPTPRGRKAMRAILRGALAARSISWECLAHLPGYSALLRSQDWTGAYQRHRRNLQLIGLPEPGRRWVLKDPSHLFALGALLRVYPDALVIQTHRAPEVTIASVCSLAAQASAGWSATFTGAVIGRDQLELWARGLEDFTAERASLRSCHGPQPAKQEHVLVMPGWC